jgi:putative FmdB family regulatory protein
MPKYTYACDSCNNRSVRMADAKQKTDTCDVCGSNMTRQLPSLNGPAEVTETVDSFMNVKHRQDQKSLIKERNDEYYWKVEVPKLANDPTYALETKLENGWIWIDDNNQIHVHDKPPYKR